MPLVALSGGGGNGNGRLTIIGADLWTTWFEIRWLLRYESDLYDRLIDQWWTAGAQWRWFAEDEKSHMYDSVLGGGGGGNGRWSGRLQVVPELDSAARALALHIPIPPQGERSQPRISLPPV